MGSLWDMRLGGDHASHVCVLVYGESGTLRLMVFQYFREPIYFWSSQERFVSTDLHDDSMKVWGRFELMDLRIFVYNNILGNLELGDRGLGDLKTINIYSLEYSRSSDLAPISFYLWEES